MAYEITIADETADRLVVDVLRGVLAQVRSDIHKLQQLTHAEPWQQEDLVNDLAMETHLVEVIRYFTPPQHHDSI